MDLQQRLKIAAQLAANFEYQSLVLPRGEAADLLPKHDQSHLLHFWDTLSGEQQTNLADQIKMLFPVPSPDDLEKERADLAKQVAAGVSSKSLPARMGVTNILHDSLRMSSSLPTRFEAPDPVKDIIDVTRLSPEERSALEELGVDELAQGRGAVLVLAGGSGTRLGVSIPKGMLVCPDTAAPRSLFQFHAERILALQREFTQRRADTLTKEKQHKIAMVVMLSPQNEAASKDFFKQNDFFGLEENQVLFFTQSCMPCFNPNGKIVLGAPGSIAMAPGGNAGIYPAIFQSGVLAELRKRGVRLLQIVTVDNLLVPVADPVLFGSAVVKRGGSQQVAYTDVVAKTCAKLHDNEAVGVFARRTYPDWQNQETSELRWGVVEYSEIGPEVAARKRPGSQERLFNAGNIAVHLFSLDFVATAAQRMLSDFTYYHVAKKPVPTSVPLAQRTKVYGGEDYLRGAAWAPATDASTPAIKLEAFIFDLFQFAGSLKVLNVQRSEEFSAIKNADDSGSSFVSRSQQQQQHASPTQVIKKDSPQTAVLDLHTLHAAWLVSFLRANINALQHLPADDLASLIEKNTLRVEIDPLAGARASSLQFRVDHLSGTDGGAIKKIIHVSDADLAKIKEFCGSAQGYCLVLHLLANGELKAVDMLERADKNHH